MLPNRTSGERDATQPQARDQTEPTLPNATNRVNFGRRNSLDSERSALRRFATVFGAVSWSPASHVVPGEVVSPAVERTPARSLTDDDLRALLGT